MFCYLGKYLFSFSKLFIHDKSLLNLKFHTNLMHGIKVYTKYGVVYQNDFCVFKFNGCGIGSIH